MTSSAQWVPGPGPKPGASGADLVLVLIQAWRLLLAVAAAAGVGGIILAVLLPLRYTASFVFLPEARPNTSQLPAAFSSIAAQLGITTGTLTGESPAFYVAVLSSRAIATELLTSPFPGSQASDSSQLWRLLRKTDVEAALQDYGKVVQTTASPQTNLVTVNVTTPWPALSAAAAERLIGLLTRFNTSMRQRNAHQTRVFVSERTAEADSALQAAEDDVRRFVLANRDPTASPNLRFEYDRLQRQVRLREEVALDLHRQLDQSMIAEANDVPAITIVDPPVVPHRKSGPKRWLVVVGVELAALGIAVAVTLGRAAVGRMLERHPELLTAGAPTRARQ